MSLSRRFFLKTGAIAGAGSLLLGRAGLAGKGRGKRGRKIEASNDASGSSDPGPSDLVTFPGTNVTYKPFTQTFGLPKVLGFDSNEIAKVIDSDGVVMPTNSDPDVGQDPIPLDPYPGSPGLGFDGAVVGSKGVYHGIAPEYSRNNPTHFVSNSNMGEDPPDPKAGDCQHLTAAYPWDRYDDRNKINVETYYRQETRNGEAHYALEIRNSRHEWAPDVVTDILAYRDAGVECPTEDPMDPDPATGLSVTGEFPAPTIVARQTQPTVIRVHNRIKFRPPGPAGAKDEPTECSVHLHGDHTPCHSDGYPDFYILPEKKRDYYYPNVGPRDQAKAVTEKLTKELEDTEGAGLTPLQIAEQGCLGNYSVSDLPTTMWYHEHGMDITGYLVCQGLAGFYLIQDDHEVSMTTKDAYGNQMLPSFYGKTGQDVPMALMDQVIDLAAGNGILPYDFFDHNGRLGNVFSVNGKLQPYYKVGNGKYRFRFLNASNARVYQLELKPEDGSKLNFVQIGQDTWELDTAVERETFPVWMAERVDVIIDFSKFEHGDVIWLNNIMQQKSGRRADGPDSEKPTPLVKFIVDKYKEVEDVTVEAGDKIRCFTPIKEKDVLATRYFTFTRRNGAWQINNRFFSPRTTNSVPILNSAERWIFQNKSGGWSHPIHIHLEAHEIYKYNGIPKFLSKSDEKAGKFNPEFPAGFVNNVDVSPLEPGGETEFLMKFRTFTGPFVFHCHVLEHEDMRMMNVFDPRPAGEPSLNDGNRPHNSPFSADGVSSYIEVSGMVGNETDNPNKDVNDPQPDNPDFGPPFFDREGDRELLEERNVGFPSTDFPEAPHGQIDPGPPDEDARDFHDDD
ncbi:MAG: multicopper oxidase domain-containing protein [Myxococcales bacterium]|nr:multicopper oxidase domain-containing protein [Myxococcales bacterium]